MANVHVLWTMSMKSQKYLIVHEIDKTQTLLNLIKRLKNDFCGLCTTPNLYKIGPENFCKKYNATNSTPDVLSKKIKEHDPSGVFRFITF
jgi:hypothetical protein